MGRIENTQLISQIRVFDETSPQRVLVIQDHQALNTIRLNAFVKAH